MEIGTSNLEIFQNMRQIKKNNNRLFDWVFFYLFSDSVSLSISGQWVAILKFVHVLDGLAFPETLAHRCSTGTDIVPRFSHK